MKKLLLSISVFFSVSAFSQASLSQSLQACYALDGNASEPINALTGTLSVVTPTVNRFSQPNTALYFSGTTTSYVRLPNNNLIKPTAVSISLWVRASAISSAGYIIYTTNGCPSYFEGYTIVMIQTGANQFRFQLVKSNSTCTSGGQTALNGTTTTYSTNTWYHVGAYIGPDSLKLYVNGASDGVLANANPLVYNGATNVFLGGTGQSPNFPLNGTIDNVRIYNRKVTQSEFVQLYNLDPICQPQPIASFVATPSLGICVGQPVSLMSGTTNTPTAWTWTMTGGTPSVSTVQNPTVSFATPGPHTITLVSSNSFGSSNPYSQILTVSTCIGINELTTLENISIAPNPNNGEFFVNGLPVGAKLEIYNALGSLVYSSLVETDKEKINLSSQRAGMYFVKCSMAGRTVTTKLVKE